METPLEHSLVHKRPRDQERFASLLDQLENLFVETKHPQNRQIHEEVLEAIVRVRRDLVKETAYMPTAIVALESKIADYMAHSRDAATQARKDQLDALLEELIGFRHKYSIEPLNAESSGRAEFIKRRQSVQQQSKKYLDAVWMQTPWLTTYMLTMLLDCELAVFDEETKLDADSAAGVLKIVRDEVSMGYYDSDESMRRLQYQETKGLYVNSLIYPLLRLNSLTIIAKPRLLGKAEGAGG